MKIIDGALRMRGCAEDRALVVFQHFEPRADLGDVIITIFEGKPEIGTEEGGIDLKIGLLLLPTDQSATSKKVAHLTTRKPITSGYPRM